MVKSSLRIDDTLQETISNTIIKSLEQNKLEVKLENFTHESLEFGISQRSNSTRLQVKRNPYKPLFIELDVSYLHLQEEKTALKNFKKQSASQTGHRNFSSFFGLYIFFGLLVGVVSALFFLANQLFSFTQGILRGLAVQILLGCVVVLSIFGVFLFLPYYRNRRLKQIQEFDYIVLDIVNQALAKIQKDKHNRKKVRKCWNCFNDVQTEFQFCEFCGKELELFSN